MSQGDNSFTFLDRVKEVELNIDDGRWQSALALTLTIPDICGGIAFPEIVKRHRDGSPLLDKQKKPTRDVGGQYVLWVDEYASDFLKISPEDTEPYICGERCWQLRCEYLHQNKGFLNDEKESTIRFHLGVNCGTSVCQLDEDQTQNGDIRIDIEQFCRRMCQAATSYYNETHKEKDFSLYHTPVLDFIQAKRIAKTNPLIVIMCDNFTYAGGLEAALKDISERILIFSDPEKAKKALGKEKPAVWIVTEALTRQPNQPWRVGMDNPVILLAKEPGYDGQIKKSEGKLKVITFPLMIEKLKEAVNFYLS